MLQMQRSEINSSVSHSVITEQNTIPYTGKDHSLLKLCQILNIYSPLRCDVVQFDQ